MNINGCKIDMEKAAYDIALLYTKQKLESGEPPKEGEVDNLLQYYLHAYLSVMQKEKDELEAIVR